MTQHAETVRVERGAKRVRAYLGGELVVDSSSPLLVWEVPYYPTYYFPEPHIRAELVDEGGEQLHSPSRGDAKDPVGEGRQGGGGGGGGAL
jgi:uncharacterized protein (DUF427 family)